MICPPPTEKPVGLCYCGCGFLTTRLKNNDKRLGYKVGEYRKFISGHNSRRQKRPGMGAKLSAAISGDKHWNYGRKASLETRQKISEAGRRRHANRPDRYDGGYPNQLGRWSPEANAWRVLVYERDGYKCQDCDTPGGWGTVLNAHHIKPWAKYPELRYEVINGRTLCTPCHKKMHASKRRRKAVASV